MILAERKAGAISRPWAFAYVLLVALFLAYSAHAVILRLFFSRPDLSQAYTVLVPIGVLLCRHYIRLALALAGALLSRRTTIFALKGDNVEMLGSPFFRRRRADVEVVKLTPGRRLFANVLTLEILFQGGGRWFVPGFLVRGDVASLSQDVLRLTSPAAGEASG